jgi:short-subunit dehydrogenase
MNQAICIIGATSGIAEAIAHELASRRCSLVLAGRARDKLDRLAADLRVRHRIDVATVLFDALRFDEHQSVWDQCEKSFESGLDGVIVCHGYLGSQHLAEQDLVETQRIIDANFTSCASMLNLAAAYFERRERGFLAAISSVAGDRGRQSNFVYGASKAALNAYLQGLRNRLHRHGVHVLTIKPGFVDTPMLDGQVRSRLVASPQRVARDICRAIQRRRNVIYTPWFWRPIMFVIRMIPEPIFKRMKL